MCKGCGAEVIGRPDKQFCSDRCRVAYWMAQHPRKGRKPKRIRSRERERLQRMITSKAPLWMLRRLAECCEAIELADKFVEWGYSTILLSGK